MGVAVARSPILKSIWSVPCFLHPASGSPAATVSVKRHNEGIAGHLSMINPQSSGNRDGRQIEWRLHRRKIVRMTALLMLNASLVLAFQAPAPASPSTHPLTGRHFANVMGFRGADWLERPERESE